MKPVVALILLTVVSLRIVAEPPKIINVEFETVAAPGTNNHHVFKAHKSEMTYKDQLMHFTGYCTNDMGRGRTGELICHMKIVKFKCSSVAFFQGVTDFTNYGVVKTMTSVKLSDDLSNLKFHLEDGKYNLDCEVQKKTDDNEPKLSCLGYDKTTEKRLTVEGLKESVTLSEWCKKPMTLRGLDYLN